MGGPSGPKSRNSLNNQLTLQIRAMPSLSEYSVSSSEPSIANSQATTTSNYSRLIDSSDSSQLVLQSKPDNVTCYPLKDESVYHHSIKCVIHYSSKEEYSQIKRALKQHIMQHIKDTYDVKLVTMGNSAFLAPKDIDLENQKLSTKIVFKSDISNHAAVQWKTIVPDRKLYPDRHSYHIAFEPLQASFTSQDDARAPFNDRSCIVSFSVKGIRNQHLGILATNNNLYSPAVFSSILDAFSAFKLCNVMKDRGEAVTAIKQNKVFGETTFVNAGCEIRAGHQGQVVFDQHGNPSVNTSECTACFFQDTLVSEFLIQHFGASVAARGTLSEEQLEKTSKILRGVTVIVAVTSKMHKQIYSVNNLTSSIRAAPHAVHGLARHITVPDLKYPDMPCVNVGTESRPFLFPIEFCKIMPNQIFNHQAPISAVNNVFDLRASHHISKPIDAEVQKVAQPTHFPKVKQDDFRVYFLHIHEADSATSTLSKEALDQLRSAMSNRFGNRLHAAIHYGKATSCLAQDASSICVVIQDLVRVEAKSTKVVVVSIPASLDKSCVDSIRRFCDIELGVHCVAVNARQVQSRHNPGSASSGMVKYSGQIVRKILAQCLIRPQPTLTAANVPGQFIGVHINEMISGTALVSMVALGSTSGLRARTAHQLFDSTNTLDLYCNIAAAVRELSDLPRLPTVVFQSVSDSHGSVYLKDVIVSQQLEILMVNNTAANLALVHFHQDHQVALSESSLAMTATSSTHVPSYNSSEEISQQMHERMTSMLDAEQVLSNVYPHSATPSKKPFHVSYRMPLAVCESAANKKIALNAFSQKIDHLKYEAFEKRPLPAMLHLARKASQRARLYVETAQDGSLVLNDKVHPNLRNKLYYV